MSYVAVAVGIAGLVVSAVQYSDSSKKQVKLGNQGIALSALSQADQRILNDKILRANTQTERLQIMADAVASINAAQAVQASKNTNTTATLVIVAGVALITAAFLIKKV